MSNYSEKSYIKFWGVRGSNPTPDKNKMQFGGDTSCIEIRTKDNDLIILDMGTGLRNLGKQIIADNTSPNEINIFLSHYHWDHIMGFFYFAPLYDSKFTINIHGYNKKTSIQDLSDNLMNKDFWPVDEKEYKAKINFIELDETTNEEKLVKINKTAIYYSIHPHPNGANSFRVETNNKKIVYITDCEHPEGNLNPNVIKISNEADILIHDSHYTISDLINHKGWGHSSWKQAADVSIISRVEKLILFHYSPEYDDEQISKIEKNAQKKFINTVASYQELLIEL